MDIMLDLYHRPDKRANPRRQYRHAYDIYSLGLVLLEIGNWKPLSTLLAEDHYDDYDPLQHAQTDQGSSRAAAKQGEWRYIRESRHGVSEYGCSGY
jgi:hypothetical protein